MLGHAELVTPSEVRGWAVDVLNPDRQVVVELLIEGRSAGAAATGQYRPDIRARFGGEGRAGFTLSRAATDGGGEGAAVLRDIASGVVLHRFQVTAPKSPPLDAALALRSELAELRDLLRKIEARLPDFGEAFAFSLENYDVYASTYYTPAPPEVGTRPPVEVSVIVDATDVSIIDLNAALLHVARQQSAPSEVIVIHAGGDRSLDVASCLESWREELRPAQLSPISADGGKWADAFLRAVERAETDHLIVVRQGARLAPDAVDLIADSLRRGAALVYADADRVGARPDGVGGGRRDPVLRTDFDPELLRQGIDLGEVLGLSREMVITSGLRSEYGADALFDLVLRCAELLDPSGVLHIPRILAHVVGAAATRADLSSQRLAAVRDHLERTGVDAAVTPQEDPFGARVPTALRVRRAVPEAARVAVIVPTRDRLDLLGPCIASLSAAALHNRVALEILVVDNRSTAPATRVFLESYARLARLRVLEHDGAFNWALINNRAAEATDADVLIFLNNDTVVATPDWCDELCGQALRPDVGAVGARLLYEDATIQHAGVVLGGWHAFAAHEGVGAPADSAGYLGRHALVRQVSAVTGACLATRAEVFRRLGGFDAVTFPVESNDIDYCLRARAAGLQVIYDPYATLYHFESKSRGHNIDPESWAMAESAGAAFRSRWGEAYRSDPFYNPHFDRSAAPLSRLGPPPRLGGAELADVRHFKLSKASK